MMTFPLTLQSDIDAARLTLLRRRAYAETIEEAFVSEGYQVSVDRTSVQDFADQATGIQRQNFFSEAPAEIAAAFVLCLPQEDRARLIASLLSFDEVLFTKLFEGL